MDGKLRGAYEVSFRSEWTASFSDFRQKMERFHLRRYIILAGGVKNDEASAAAVKRALELEPFERDIAVVAILDLVHFLAAELSPIEFREAINECFNNLSDLNRCGDPKSAATSREVVHRRLPARSTASSEEDDDCAPV
jgi:hypothetical protein